MLDRSLLLHAAGGGGAHFPSSAECLRFPHAASLRSALALCSSSAGLLRGVWTGQPSSQQPLLTSPGFSARASLIAVAPPDGGERAPQQLSRFQGTRSPLFVGGRRPSSGQPAVNTSPESLCESLCRVARRHCSSSASCCHLLHFPAFTP